MPYFPLSAWRVPIHTTQASPLCSVSWSSWIGQITMTLKSGCVNISFSNMSFGQKPQTDILEAHGFCFPSAVFLRHYFWIRWQCFKKWKFHTKKKFSNTHSILEKWKMGITEPKFPCGSNCREQARCSLSVFTPAHPPMLYQHSPCGQIQGCEFMHHAELRLRPLGQESWLVSLHILASAPVPSAVLSVCTELNFPNSVVSSCIPGGSTHTVSLFLKTHTHPQSSDPYICLHPLGLRGPPQLVT